MINPMHTYVTNFVPNDIPWYERDGLMAWYNKCKKTVNYDIIYRECRGEVVLKHLLKYYQNVNERNVSEYPTPEQDKTW